MNQINKPHQAVSHNSEEGAVPYFHHPEYGFNCAQAIAHHHGADPEEISMLSNYGGGQAPHGFCGALHGALHILRHNPAQQEKVKKRFINEVGSPFCHAIRGRHLASCRRCVEVADETLSKILHSKTEPCHHL